MIQEIIAQWEQNKHKLEQQFKLAHPGSYTSIVKSIFEHVISDYKTEDMTVIDDGNYQGTQIFIIPKDTYQPGLEDYLMTHTYYGSCSACDTLEGIRGYESGNPTEEQVKDYMTLALHLVQKLQKLDSSGNS